MPSFNNATGDALRHYHMTGQAALEAQRRQTDRNSIIQAITTTQSKLTDQNSIFFVLSLFGYLAKLENDSVYNHNNYVTRGNFIVEICQILTANEKPQKPLKEKLSENNIKGFKGIFSQRLYDVLKRHRGLLEKQEGNNDFAYSELVPGKTA